MAVPQKPDLFEDQAEADAKALEFLEAVAAFHAKTLPGVTIVHREHALPVGSAQWTDGRTSFVWAHGEQRLLAMAVVTRDAMNRSLLVTKQFQ